MDGWMCVKHTVTVSIITFYWPYFLLAYRNQFDVLHVLIAVFIGIFCKLYGTEMWLQVCEHFISYVDFGLKLLEFFVSNSLAFIDQLAYEPTNSFIMISSGARARIFFSHSVHSLYAPQN